MTTQIAQSNEQVVRSVYDAFARGDLEAVLALFDPDVEIRQSDELPWGGTHHGHDGAVRFFAELTSHIRTQVEIDRLIVAGDAVVESGTTRGIAVDSGREFAIAETHVWRLREGRIAGMEAFVDNAAMLAALAA